MSARAFAIAVMVLAPMPSIGAALGVDLPVGLKPLDALVLVGLLLAAHRRIVPLPLRSKTLLALIAVNFLVFTIAWVRTYGLTPALEELALLVKPFLLVIAGFLAVRLLEPGGVRQSMGIAFGVALVVIGVSVLLHRLGIYEPDYELATRTVGGANQFGGLLLDGNTAGPVIAIFTVPAYLLLRTDYPRLSLGLLLFAFPVLLTTVSRAALLCYMILLAALVVVERANRRTLVVAGVVAVCAALWTLTFGGAEREFISDNVERLGSDPNALLSGRLQLWDRVLEYLAEPSHLLVGGGLGDFRETPTPSLRESYAPHNTLFFALTNGGIPMALAFVALFGWLIAAPNARDRTSAMALRFAAVGLVIVGLTGDVTPFDPVTALLWPLVALAYRREQPAGSGDSGGVAGFDGADVQRPADSPPERLSDTLSRKPTATRDDPSG